MSTPANILTAELLIEIQKRFPNVRVWRSNRIDAMAIGKGGSLRRVQAGIDGQGDITGITGGGIRLEIEVKVGKDRLRDSQKAFKKMILDHGGIYIEARSVEQCLEELGRLWGGWLWGG
jgi:hypothetical protein